MTVLVLQALGLGDFLTALPALRGLRRHFHDQELIWAGNPAFLDLAEPLVDQVFTVNGISEWVQLPKSEVAVNLHGNGPRSHELLAFSPQLIAHFHPTLAPSGPLWSSTQHMRQLWVDLLSGFGIAADANDFRLEHGAAQGTHVLIHVGAKDRDRWWPIERFNEVANSLADVVISAGPGEYDRADQVKAEQFRGSLLELAQVIQQARLVISADSGVAHLAYAFGRPTITLFGPVPAERWGPPNDTQHRSLGNLHSYEVVRPDGPTSPHLMHVSADQVLATASELLSLSA